MRVWLILIETVAYLNNGTSKRCQSLLCYSIHHYIGLLPSINSDLLKYIYFYLRKASSGHTRSSTCVSIVLAFEVLCYSWPLVISTHALRHLLSKVITNPSHCVRVRFSSRYFLCVLGYKTRFDTTIGWLHQVFSNKCINFVSLFPLYSIVIFPSNRSRYIFRGFCRWHRWHYYCRVPGTSYSISTCSTYKH